MRRRLDPESARLQEFLVDQRLVEGKSPAGGLDRLVRQVCGMVHDLENLFRFDHDVHPLTAGHRLDVRPDPFAKGHHGVALKALRLAGDLGPAFLEPPLKGGQVLLRTGTRLVRGGCAEGCQKRFFLLLGRLLKGGELGEVSVGSELAALTKLTSNWKSVIDDALSPLERSRG